MIKSNRRNVLSLIAISAALLSTTAMAAPPNDAADPTNSDGFSIRVGDAPATPITSDMLLNSQTNPEPVTPQLIDDPVAWSACFGPILNPDYSLKQYVVNAYQLGTFNVDLNCGTSNYGWHHIQAAHQQDWQQRLDTANQSGAGPVSTWDDLMSLATYAVLKNPWWYTQEYSGKRCFTQHIAISRDSDSEVIYEAWPTIVVSMTNNRVITSYPTTTEDCSRQAPWA